jgi:HEAT repeat protein
MRQSTLPNRPPRPGPTPTETNAFLVALGLTVGLLGSCASNKNQQKVTPGSSAKQEETEVRERRLEREFPTETGALVLELDGLLRAWNQSKLSAVEGDEPKHRALDLDLRRGARQRLDELIDLLETGAPRNRQVAAMAIGFSGSERALPPLLAALDDELPGIVQNALIGLGLLANADTPLVRIRELLLEAPESTTRNNAGFALQRLLEVGVRAPGLLDDLRLALIDPEPGVRVQAATSLRLLQDPEALPELADRLKDDEDLVAVAAARAIRRIGQEIDAESGRCARNLFEAWKDTKGNRKAALRYEMSILRRADLGDKEEEWREWAYKLP